MTTVELRPLADADLPAVADLLADPTVARWWRRSHEDVREEFEDPFAIVVEGELAGVLDVYEQLEPDYRHASLDIVLAESFQDRGIGRTALRLAVRRLTDRGHHRVTIDPALANARAIRCYEAVGFRPVGVLRRYERGPDGEWHDNLLMDLLSEELPEPGGPADPMS